jgi:hypothetical protein
MLPYEPVKKSDRMASNGGELARGGPAASVSAIISPRNHTRQPDAMAETKNLSIPDPANKYLTGLRLGMAPIDGSLSEALHCSRFNCRRYQRCST